MKLLSLISGGKDSIYSILCAKRQGHDVVMLAHLKPPEHLNTNEMDSYMYQTICYNVVPTIGECLNIPLVERCILGKSKVTETLDYSPNEGDEVEDLYKLVVEALNTDSSIEGILSGAICSRYQLERVKNVGQRLGLKTVQPLWQKDQSELLKNMIDDKIMAIVVKTCCMGLNESHLGKYISELHPEFVKMEKDFGFNTCGEGGEYETLVLDCPMYISRIVITEFKKIHHSTDPYAPTILYVPIKWRLEPKHI